MEIIIGVEPDELKNILLVKKNNPRKRKPILIDIGMASGDFTKTFLMYFPKAICYGVEPCEAVRDIKKQFDSDSDVRIYNLALGEKEKKKVEFFDSGLVYGCSSFYKRGIYEKDSTLSRNLKKYEVKMTTYDKLFGNMDVFFLKIDAEGYEGHIIEGAKRAINKKLIKYIQFEYGLYAADTGIEYSNIIPTLYKNYRIFTNEHIEIGPDYDEKPKNNSPLNFFAIRREE